MTHTKGPWRLERGEKQINTHALIVHGPDDLGPVAFATPVNGALIAAAPELLTACDKAIALLHVLIEEYEDNEVEPPAVMTATHQRLLQAISKARS